MQNPRALALGGNYPSPILKEKLRKAGGNCRRETHAFKRIPGRYTHQEKKPFVKKKKQDGKARTGTSAFE